WSAQPVVVPRSSASIARLARTAGARSGIASRRCVARVRSAMGGLLFWLAARVEDDGGLALGGTWPPASEREVWAGTSHARETPGGGRGRTRLRRSPPPP